MAAGSSFGKLPDESQVCHEHESADGALEQLQQESCRQKQALAQERREKELLGREKAALEVRLATTEQHRHVLPEQLASVRSVKETHESSLLVTKEEVSQQEISRDRLEAQLHSVRQAVEEIQGEVKCLRHELEAERHLRKQEQEDMSQQLLQAQQQYHNALRLQESAHQEEIKKLLQDLVGKLTDGSAACREWQKAAAHKAEQDQSKAQERSRRMVLEVEQLWKALKSLLTVSLEEKERSLRTLEEKHLAQVSELSSALEEAKQFQSAHTGELQELKHQNQSLQEAMLEKEIFWATREQQLLRKLEESRAGKGSLRDTVHTLQTEAFELRLMLRSSQDTAEALATRRPSLELELGKSQAERDRLRAHTQKLQKELAESREAACRAEDKKESVEAALKEEASARKAEVGTLRQEVESLKRKVESTEKERLLMESPLNAQQAVAEGEQQSWLSERRLISQILERLQRADAILKDEKMELKQHSAELRRTLEQVEHEWRRLKSCFRGQMLPDAGGFSLSKSDQHEVTTSRQKEESHAHSSQQLAELQNQVSLLQRQLARGHQRTQEFIEICAKTNQELSDLRQELSCSLAAVLREPKAAVLEAETQKLSQSLSRNLAHTDIPASSVSQGTDGASDSQTCQK